MANFNDPNKTIPNAEISVSSIPATDYEMTDDEMQAFFYLDPAEPVPIPPQDKQIIINNNHDQQDDFHYLTDLLQVSLFSTSITYVEQYNSKMFPSILRNCNLLSLCCRFLIIYRLPRIKVLNVWLKKRSII